MPADYPQMSPPETRVSQSYRAIWFSLIVTVPKHLRQVQSTRRALRGLAARRG